MNIPRPEHPRPSWTRPDWVSLNGTWEFESDKSDTGCERGLVERTLNSSILVPFAPESVASGIGDEDFHEAVWYRRGFEIPTHWDREDRVVLHFQAVDHDTTVWVNGFEMGRHRGGFTPFSFDVTEALTSVGQNTVTVRARDSRHGVQARGKQATWFERTHAFYTRTTGIWQSVWLESVPLVHARRAQVRSTIEPAVFDVEVPLSTRTARHRVEVSVTVDGVEVASGSSAAAGQLQHNVRLPIPDEHRRLWQPSDPFLYTLEIRVLDDSDTIVDKAESYAGLREVGLDGHRILLNGEPVFQRLVLDQGYWPESLMTAPSDDALLADIRLAMAAGFNGARVHQKVAEERYLYHADRAGFLIWGEFADWGASGQGEADDNHRPTASFMTQWAEVLERDLSHPSIIGWCPLNETYQLLNERITVLDDVTQGMFHMTKLIDPTRPVIDASGYAHRVAGTDVWDNHDYEQDPAVFAGNHAALQHGRPYENRDAQGRPYSIAYAGQPTMVSEFGGIWWEDGGGAGTDQANSWGYGDRVQDLESFYRRFEGLVRVLDGNSLMFGYCYTQLTDVFQEMNGLFTFDRRPKFDLDRIRRIQSATPAYERAASSVEVVGA